MGTQLQWSDAKRVLTLRLAPGSRVLAPLRRRMEVNLDALLRTSTSMAHRGNCRFIASASGSLCRPTMTNHARSLRVSVCMRHGDGGQGIESNLIRFEDCQVSVVGRDRKGLRGCQRIRNRHCRQLLSVFRQVYTYMQIL